MQKVLMTPLPATPYMLMGCSFLSSRWIRSVQNPILALILKRFVQ
jgi:hypothetical protein